MQIVNVTNDLLLNPACSADMLRELLTTTLGYSDEAAEKIMAQTLSKAGGVMKTLAHNQARTVIMKKLQDHPELGESYTSGKLRVQFQCLATPEEPKTAQQQEKKSGAPRSSTTGSLRGAYWVKKQRNIDDAGQKEVYDALWSCRSFEEFYAKAPAKSVTRTGRAVTSVNVMGYAIKMGWIVAGEKPQEQEQQAEQQQAA